MIKMVKDFDLFNKLIQIYEIFLQRLLLLYFNSNLIIKYCYFKIHLY